MSVDENNTSKLDNCLKLSIDTQVLGSQENVSADIAVNFNSLNTGNEGLLWYAMSATFGREMKAKEFLEKNNVHCFVPLRCQL